MNRCDRTWSINWVSSEPECSSPLPSALGLSSEQTTPYTSAMPVSPLPSWSPLPQTSPESLPCPSASSRYVGLDEDTPEGAISPPYTHVSPHGTRKRKLSQSVSPVLPKRQCLPSIPPRRHSTVIHTPRSDERPDLSPPQTRIINLDEAVQPMPPVLINPDTPVTLGVFDWNSISDPLQETASSMCM